MCSPAGIFLFYSIIIVKSIDFIMDREPSILINQGVGGFSRKINEISRDCILGKIVPRVVGFLFLFISICYMASPYMTKGMFFVRDEIIVNYWSWKLNWQDFFYLFPNGKHDDRPVGWIFVNLINYAVGLNYHAQLSFFIIVHFINTILLYKFVKTIFTEEYYSFLAAFIFACHFPANSTVHYIGAVFDLLCCTFSLISLILFQKNQRVALFFSVLCYFVSVRSKEMSVLLPGVLTLLVWAQYNGRQQEMLKNILRRCWPFYIVLLMMMAFFLSSKRIGYDVDVNHPIAMKFSSGVFIDNLKLYLLTLMFYTNQHLIIMLSFFAFAASLLGNYRLMFFSAMSFILMLTPVLFYTHHRFNWFLYIPSIFFSIVIVIFIRNIISLINKIFFGKFTIYSVKIMLFTVVFFMILSIPLTERYHNYMNEEKKERIPIGKLYTYLKERIPLVKTGTHFYLKNIPNIAANQAPDWLILDYLFRIIYEDDSLVVFTDNMYPNIFDKYVNDMSPSIFLEYSENGFNQVEKY